MGAVVSSSSSREAIITCTGYGYGVGLRKGRFQHLFSTFLSKLTVSRYISLFLYLRIWVLRRSLLCQLLPFKLSATVLSLFFFLFDPMDSLALNMTEILNLTDREAIVHDIEDDFRGDNPPPQSFCLVFRVLTPRTIKLEWFEEAMRNAWITRASLTFSSYGSSMFMVEFECEGDMRRVLEGQPWHFDHCLVTCANPAGLDTLLPNQLCYSPFWIQVHAIPFGQKSLRLAQLIGNEVGDFLEVDKATIFKVSSLFLCVRVLVDISKPIPRGILIDFKSIHREKWLSFKYENLPNICYHCGMFDHTLTKCIRYLKKCDDHSAPPPLPYKIPLKAPPKTNFKRNPFDLSNSFPLDELTHPNSNVDQSLVAAVNRFLSTEDHGPGSSVSAPLGNVSDARLLGMDQVTFSSDNQSHSAAMNPETRAHFGENPIGVLCDMPAMTTHQVAATVHENTTHEASFENTLPRLSEKAKGKAVAGVKRTAFLPQTVVVGDSLRNILKRARAGPTIAEVSSAINASFEQAVPKKGLRGGLLLFWKSDVLVNILNYSPNHIDCIVTINDNISTHVSCFYGSPYVHDKIHTWTLLHRLYDNAPNLPWLIFGDFNDYLSISDRSSPHNVPAYAMFNFRNFINKFSLTPLQPVGNPYTWKHGHLCERLDWGIVNSSWLTHFPRAVLYHLGFYGSDHRVLKIVLDDASLHTPRNKRFLFENFWLTEPSFFDTVKDSWSKVPSHSATTPLGSFLSKQQSCIAAIKDWNGSFKSLSSRIHTLENSLNTLHSNLPLNREDIKRASTLQSTLDFLLYKHEVFWKQRSKIHWLNAGDKNTKYFHNKATARKKTNNIRKLKCEDGRQVTSFSDICHEVCAYFDNLFKSQSSDATATNLIFTAIDKSLTLQQISFLDSPFEAGEVKQALFQLSGDKAPGLDGLNPAFYQKNWSVIGPDLTTVVLDILNGNADFSSINDTLIVLIPKKTNASTLKDFRPISLCSTVYKIVSKTIANRLKLVLGDLISSTQGAFLSERIIFDNIYIAQELVHAINHRKHGKIGWVGLKLDMEKAFDRVEWSFLTAILQRFQFPPHFINLIFQCVSSTSIRFSINGQITDPIFPSRGIRQGDPLSPYLFLLCSEGLTAALRVQENLGLFKGISIARTASAVSHLLFADDTLIFTTASFASCNSLKEALTLYNLASGQKVNYSKSSILFSPNTPPAVSSYFFDTLGLEAKPFISKYLGVPQCFGRSKKSSFDFILHRIGSHLSAWNEKLFSKAGKEVLLKAVIQAIPSYAMSCFRLPVSVCQKIEKMMAQFWWGSMGKGSKIHWKAWTNLCTSKFFGGLGFRSLVHHNQAMIAKQAWRVLSNPNSLLAAILKAKDLLNQGLMWKVGNGCSIRTLENYWVPDSRFLKFIAIDPPPSDRVSFFIDENGHCNRAKLDQYFDSHTVSSILKVPIGGLNKEDHLIWNKDTTGMFSVKTGYHLAHTVSLPPSSSNFSFIKKWWTALWTLNLPPKIKSLAWRAYHHILPTALNLFLKKSLPSPCCSLCHCPSESVTHALLDCSSAVKIWKASPLKHFYATHRHVDIKEFLIAGYSHLNKDDLTLLLATVWAIWNFRNKKLFANFNMSSVDVVEWINSYLSDYNAAQMGMKKLSSSQILYDHEQPKQVNPGYYQLNIDAALCSSQGKLGFGAVISDWCGRIVAGLSIPAAGDFVPLMAEALALRESLNWCYLIRIPIGVIKSSSKLWVDQFMG
uniref:Reverse transcriptase domain-containing protein n=1 Tax=Cannabis sativa TaxID=3483 RepID=A0A803Q8H5_CANSA